MHSTTEKPAAGSVHPTDVSDSSPQPLTPIDEQDESKLPKMAKIGVDQNKSAIIFNKDADLLFKLKTPTGFARYRVNKFNVSSASDAFSRLLFETNSCASEIELSDEPTAFATLLHVIHYNFGQVPKQPSMDDLFEICIVSSQYNCTHLLAPWAERWAAVLGDFTKSKMAADGNHKALWVSWVLGCVGPFQSMADSLILTSKLDQDQELVHASGRRLKDLILPVDLLGRIMEIRSHTVALILSEIQRSMDLLINKKSTDETHFCKIGTDVTECNMMLLASATMVLVPGRLFPVPPPDEYTLSIADLKTAVYGIHYRAWIGRDHAPHKAHTACNLGLKDAVRTILDQMPSPVQRLHLKHLAEQADTTGIDNGDALSEFQYALDPEIEVEDTTKADNHPVIVHTEVQAAGEHLETTDSASPSITTASGNSDEIVVENLPTETS